jgi:hypothetical protein
MWMNSKREPIVKVSATTEPVHMIYHLGNRNLILLGNNVVLGLFFIYFVSLIYLVIYLLTNRDGTEEIPKHAHHKRTHSR